MSDDNSPADPPEGSPGGQKPLKKAAQRLLSWLSRRNGDASLRESLEEVFEFHEDAERPVSPEERAMLLNIVKFAELSAEDVMVPRADIVAVDLNTPIDELLPLFSEKGHSRLPVYKRTLDDTVGMIHIKDVLRAMATEREGQTPPEIKDLKRPVLFIPPSVPVTDLLLKMRTTRIHLALVVDEFGGTDGLVTIEDLVEEIVGEIEEGRGPAAEPTLQEVAPGEYVIDARLPIKDLEEELSLALLDKEWEEDIDTVGGLVVSLVGRVPERGEVIGHDQGVEFEVVDADPRRLKRLKIRRLPPVSKAAAH